jgi:hypothetical protein
METKAQGSTSRALLALLALIPSLPLSLMVASSLDYRYSPTDDDAIFFGLLGSVFLVLFDLFFLLFLIGARLRAGQRVVATKRELSVLGLGLLIAPLVGVFPWSFRWLYNSSPWVPFLLLVFFPAAALIVALILAWRAPRETRRSNLVILAVWTYLVAISDDLVPQLLKRSLALLFLVGLIWTALAAWKLRRARVSTAGPRNAS